MSTNETVKSILAMTGKTPKSADWMDKIFIHVTPKPEACKHDFQGWRVFDDGRGGEQVCTKCGMGAMAHTLSLDI
jgi:hypothetical protein